MIAGGPLRLVLGKGLREGSVVIRKAGDQNHVRRVILEGLKIDSSQ
jgi:hypothetical protein